VKETSATVAATLVLLVGSTACEDKKGDAPPEGTSAAVVAPSPAPSATPAAAPAAAAPAEAPLEKKCPDPAMTWLDTPSEYSPAYGAHCQGKGAARTVVAVWNGKLEDKPTFKLTNKAPVPLVNFHYRMFAYDKTGKRLDWPAPHQGPSFEGSLMSSLNSGEASDKQIGPLKSELPVGTATLEAEFDRVKWSQPSVGWFNPDLVGADRPKGGVK